MWLLRMTVKMPLCRAAWAFDEAVEDAHCASETVVAQARTSWPFDFDETCFGRFELVRS